MAKEKGTKRVNSRAKGGGFERNVAKLLQEWTGFDFHRVPASGGMRWGADNRVIGDIIAQQGCFWPFSVECKFHKTISFNDLMTDTKSKIMEFWAQAKGDVARGGNLVQPMVIFRYNGLPKKFLFIMVHVNVYKKILTCGFLNTNQTIIYKRKYVILRSDDLFKQVSWIDLGRLMKND